MNNTISLMDYIFDSELKNYLELEKTIFETVEVYGQTNDDRIKNILEKNINVAKKQIFIMLEILSRCKEDKTIKSYQERLNMKLEDLKNIERKINGFNK